MVYSSAFTFSGVYLLGVLPCAGLRLWVLRWFQAFLASGACVACASSYLFSSTAPLPWRGAFSQLARVFKLGFPFWLLCLTRRSSGRLRRRLAWSVSPLSNRFIQPMVHSPAFTFASVYSVGVLSCAGLRLRVLRRFQAFLAASACAACAGSYRFVSIAPLLWRGAFSQLARVVKFGFPLLASVSNCSLQRTATPLAELGR